MTIRRTAGSDKESSELGDHVRVESLGGSHHQLLRTRPVVLPKLEEHIAAQRLCISETRTP
jgi:hypothetical protein